MTTETTLSDDIRAVADAMRSVFTRLSEEIGDRPANSAEQRILDTLTWGTLMNAARVAENEPVGVA